MKTKHRKTRDTRIIGTNKGSCGRQLAARRKIQSKVGASRAHYLEKNTVAWLHIDGAVNQRADWHARHVELYERRQRIKEIRHNSARSSSRHTRPTVARDLVIIAALIAITVALHSVAAQQ